MPWQRTVSSSQDFNVGVTVVLAEANKDFNARLSNEYLSCIREAFQCFKVLVCGTLRSRIV